MATLERPREEAPAYEPLIDLGPAPAPFPRLERGPLFEPEALAEARRDQHDLHNSLASARAAVLSALHRLLLPGPLPEPDDLMTDLLERLDTGTEMRERRSDADELRLRLEGMPDSQLARSLAELISCLDRLDMVSPTPVASRRPSLIQPVDEGSLYAQLERNVSALRSSDVGEMARAERALLWTRIDGLLDEVKELGRQEDGPPVYEYDVAPEYDHSDALLVRSKSTSKRQVSGASVKDEKMARELDTVTQAIDRLYDLTPQLANQRVDPEQRTALREVQLARLNAAVERLSKGRMDDQRAETAPEALTRSKGKSKASELDMLLDSIDKAASRTLANQRVSISSKQRAVLVEAKRTVREAKVEMGVDSAEEARQKLILDKTGSGRMTGQDATFSPSTLRAERGKKRTNRPISGSSIADASTENALRFVAQEQRNLGSVTVRVWPAQVSFSHVDEQGERLYVRKEGTEELVAVSLPCRVQTDTAAAVVREDHLEIKLATFESSSTTRSRPDLEVVSPFSAAELKQAAPSALICSEPLCGQTLLPIDRAMTYTALPSEHWAELLDAWMCHTDLALADSLGQKARDGGSFLPRTPDEVCVGSTYLFWPTREQAGWRLAPRSQTIVDGLTWQGACCSSCGLLVGQYCEEQGVLRLRKYAVQLASEVNSLPTYSLSMHISSHLLELSQAHAVHRFIIEDDSQTSQILLWIFNPSVRVSHSGSDSPLHALSVLYAVSPSQESVEAFVAEAGGTNKVERLAHPASIVARLSRSLVESTQYQPSSFRRVGALEVAWLER